jgi:hypothetical protein
MPDSILIVTPILRDVNGKGRVFARALASHIALDYSGYLDTYSVLGGDDYSNGSGTVTAKYNRAREVFLAGNWSHMLCLESDMIVPRDTISRLLDCESSIAYGLYAFRHLGRQDWSAASVLQDHEWVSFSKSPDKAKQAWGNVVDVAGVGQGVTLIRRRVLEALPFRYWPGVSCDWALACDAQVNGFTQRCDCGCIAGHMSLTPSPCILWPDINAEKLVRIEFPK